MKENGRIIIKTEKSWMSPKINLENLIKSGSFEDFKDKPPIILTNYTKSEFIQECPAAEVALKVLRKLI